MTAHPLGHLLVLTLIPLTMACPAMEHTRRDRVMVRKPSDQSRSATSRPATSRPATKQRAALKVDRDALERALVAQHGEGQRARIRQGLAQLLARWRAEDGNARALAQFVREHFIVDAAVLDDTARHMEYALEMLDGHANEVARELARYQVLDEGPLRSVDPLLAAYSPTAHLSEDLFRSKLAFVVLLNFPLTTLQERLEQGTRWSRQQWALARLTSRFAYRIPAEVLQRVREVEVAAEVYIDTYNIMMDQLELEDGQRLFPAGLKLISHWGLRDEIRGLYAREGGLARQRVLLQVMERIIRQEIPASVINASALRWDPVANRVRQPGGAWRRAAREPDARYQRFLDVFQAQRSLDPYTPDEPTHILRSFNLGREMPEPRVRQLLESILTSPLAQQTAQLIRKRLGRPLEPFDIWYPGFRAKSKLGEPALDKLTQARYPTARAFEQDLPRILKALGFSSESAAYLAGHIVVEPARGAGHAYGAKRRADQAHLRTRVEPGGMNYKGYNIATHELGHNVEQVFSMSRIDHTLLEGVPNTGFTEAFAFLFQRHDVELLGQRAVDPQAEALQTVDRFWSTFEIAGVAVLDADLWHWLYEHPNATPAELRQATVQLTQQLWNRYYAPVFGVRDQILPAIYSHLIAYGLYTPDYPLGELITFQLERHMKGKRLGDEMERMCRLGRLAPDVWMQQAVGSEVSSAPLLEATAVALKQLAAR